MYRDNRVAVVVPAYNEEGFVGGVIESLPEYVDAAYVVDDASTDETWAEIEAHATAQNRRLRADGGASATRVVPIQHTENQGVGAAIKTGYRRAGRDDMDVAAVVAGDGQMDTSILPRLLDPVVEGTADYAKGNRLIGRDAVEGMSRWRLFGNVSLTLLTKVASGYWKTGDPQNGYTVVKLDAFDDVDLDALYDDYGFSNDVLVSFNVHDKRVVDVPMSAHYGDEESTIDYGSFIPRVSVLLARGFVRRLTLKHLVRDFHPLVLFYTVGVLLGVLGVAWAVATLLVGPVGLAVGSILVALGAVTFLFGAVFDMQVNTPLEGVADR